MQIQEMYEKLRTFFVPSVTGLEKGLDTVKTHLAYWAILGLLVVFGKVYLAEHDARLASDQAVKIGQQQVAAAQSEIAAVNAEATQKVKIVTQIVHDAKTPSQVVASVPQLAPPNLAADLGARVVPQLQPTEVAVQSTGLVEALGSLKQCNIQLSACQSASTLKDQQITAVNQEVAALKKRPAFWNRVGSTLKLVGIGVGIGLAVSGKL